jgi:predicted Zn-dependent protease
MRTGVILFLLSVFLMGCATTNLPPVTSEEYVALEDEKRLWVRSEEEQEDLTESGLVYGEEALTEYLNGVAKKLQPPEVYERVPFRVVVLKNPYSNAFAYPNGVIYVQSGLLGRIDNEAQLATLLAHEMTHATHRHTLRESRGLRNKAAVLASINATVGTLPAVGELTSTLGAIGAKAAVTGHSRELETEADNVGIVLVEQAGYDIHEAPKLFRHLKDQLVEEGIEEPFYFGSHPRLQERIDNYERLIAENSGAAKGTVNAKVFRRKTASLVLENAILELKAGRFERAIKGTEKYLAVKPKSSRGHFVMGEIYRQMEEEGSLEQAAKNYRKAVKLRRSYPDAHKGLGLVYLKQGKKKRAKKEFNTYLKLSPKAHDKEYVKQYIAQCK